MTDVAPQYKLGYFEPFALHDRLLKIRSSRGANTLGEAKRSWRVRGWKNFYKSQRSETGLWA